MADDLSQDRHPASSDAMRDFWDKRARENALWYICSNLDYAQPDSERFWASGEEDLDRILPQFEIHLDGSQQVVEIGCGTGRLTRALARRTRMVVGIDVSAEMVERARKALAAVPNAEVVLGNGRDLSDFKDASFDFGFSFIVFQHIPDPAITATYIAEIGRVLRQGGSTVFQISQRTEYHERAFWQTRHGLWDRFKWLVHVGPRGCLSAPWLGSSLTTAELEAALSKGGLRLEKLVDAGTQFCLVHASKPAA